MIHKLAFILCPINVVFITIVGIDGVHNIEAGAHWVNPRNDQVGAVDGVGYDDADMAIIVSSKW